MPVIDQYAWDQAALTLRGLAGAWAGQLQVVLARRGSTDQHVLDCARDGDRFSASFDVSALPFFGQPLPLRDGSWDIRVLPAGPAGRPAEPAGPPEPARSARPARARRGQQDVRSFGRKTYRLTLPAGGAPVLTVGPAVTLIEHGKNRRRLLNRVYYPAQRRRPVTDAVLFISWKGKQCSDNPLAIAAELRRRGDDRQQFWAVTDYALPVPDGARPVLTGTRDYFDALARSRYLISNDDMQAHYHKRPGQVYVQTWHGTLLKRIGFDVPQPKFLSGERYLTHLARDVAQWDLLLSPNPFSTPLLRSAFRYHGEILESGYPRNDILHGDADGQIAARVRRRLGLRDGQRVVLYAPTWRDDQQDPSGRYRFDFRLDLADAHARLGDDYVFLIRGHHHVAHDVPAGPRPGFAVNVTAYPDLYELLLVTDILVTDYSSVMFDFAPAGKPILLFSYDLDRYRDDVRGFYFDLTAAPPGPLLATSAEVVSAIADIGAVQAGYRAALAEFAARFAPLDDGKASARACDRIFGS